MAALPRTRSAHQSNNTRTRHAMRKDGGSERGHARRRVGNGRGQRYGNTQARVIVTGSSGFIGSAVVRAFAEHFDLVGLDRETSPHDHAVQGGVARVAEARESRRLQGAVLPAADMAGPVMANTPVLPVSGCTCARASRHTTMPAEGNPVSDSDRHEESARSHRRVVRVPPPVVAVPPTCSAHREACARSVGVSAHRPVYL